MIQFRQYVQAISIRITPTTLNPALHSSIEILNTHTILGSLQFCSLYSFSFQPFILDSDSHIPAKLETQSFIGRLVGFDLKLKRGKPVDRNQYH